MRELFPPIFLKDFPLDWTILVTAHRTETTVYNTPETRIRYRFPMQLSHSFFFHLYISLPSVFSLKRFPYVKGNIWKSVSGTVPKFQFNLLHRSFVFLSLSLSLQRLFSRLDPFVAVHREKKERLCSLEMGVSILRRESSFFAGRWKRRCTIEWGGNLENGNSASFDFFQGERYRE